MTGSPSMTGSRVGLASDNWSPVHPDILRSIEGANSGYAPAYGNDEWSKKAERAFRAEFGRGSHTYFTFGGTGANTLAIAAATAAGREAVLCAQSGHVLTDEAGALARFAGTTFLPVVSERGKLTVPRLEDTVSQLIRGEHQVLPAVLTIANATETGQVYSKEEVRELADWAHAHDLVFHMDGARLANAAVSQRTSLAAISIEAGVDVLTLGGTKNGLMFGEAVVVSGAASRRIPDGRIRRVRKQAGQLASKQRFVAAQFQTYLTTDLWQVNAASANARASSFAQRLRHLEGVDVTLPVEANMLFVGLPEDMRARLTEVADFYVYNADSGLCRIVCSYDTSPEDEEAFFAAIPASVTKKKHKITTKISEQRNN